MSTPSSAPILDGFWRLSEAKDAVRVEAAVKLLGQVKVRATPRQLVPYCTGNIEIF